MKISIGASSQPRSADSTSPVSRLNKNLSIFSNILLEIPHKKDLTKQSQDT